VVLLFGAAACPPPGQTRQTLYYDVPLDGVTLEVRLEQDIETLAVWPNISVRDKKQYSIRDPATGQWRPATAAEPLAIGPKIYVPPFVHGNGTWWETSNGIHDGIRPRPPRPPPQI
jgi:hypothetical protein